MKERENYEDTKPCLGYYEAWRCPNRVSKYASGVGSAWCGTCKQKKEEDRWEIFLQTHQQQ